MALRYLEAPVTESFRRDETFAGKRKVLYRKIDEGTYEFVGLHDPDIPDEDYPDELYAINFTSVYGGTTTLYKGTSVWNVKGSSGDTWDGKYCGSWIDVWTSKFPKGTVKCYVKGSKRAGEHTDCNSIYVGGHMILTDIQPTYGDDGKVYIIPICNAHNNYANTNEMKVCEDVGAVILNRYHKL